MTLDQLCAMPIDKSPDLVPHDDIIANQVSNVLIFILTHIFFLNLNYHFFKNCEFVSSKSHQLIISICSILFTKSHF